MPGFRGIVKIYQITNKLSIITGLNRENAIAIDSEAKDPFGGKVYYVIMQIMLPI